MGNLYEGYQIGADTPRDQQLRQDQVKSALLNDQINRKVAEENLLLKQGEAKAKARALEDARMRAQKLERLMMGTPPPIPGPGAPQDVGTGSAPAGAPAGPQMEAVAPPAGPGGPAAGFAPQGPGAPGGGSPLVTWMQANPAVGTQMINAIQTGDGDTQRKILGMFHESQGGTKRVEDPSLVKEWDTARQHGYTGTLEEWKKVGASTTNLNVNTKGETRYSEKTAGFAADRRQAYIQAGVDADSTLADYQDMYNSALEVTGTGALADARLGIRKLAQATGVWEDVAEQVTGIEDGDVAGWERLRQQTMDRVFERIKATKGAISEREMEAFTNSVAGVRNTRRGNVLILEAAMDKARVDREKANYIRRHAPRSAGTEGLELAERGWGQVVELRGEERARVKADRARLVRHTPDAAISYLTTHQKKPKVRRAFKKKYGWLPTGMK